MRKILLVLLTLCAYAFSSGVIYAEEKSPEEKLRDSYFISVAASSCLGIYTPTQSSEFNYLRDYGWKIDPYKQVSDNVESNFSIASNYIKMTGTEVFLVTFRGSASKKDWGINLKTDHVAYGGNDLASMEEFALQKTEKTVPSVHKGFNKYVDSVLRASVVDENGNFKGVFKRVADNDNAFLVLTGHSLGGAAATLLGERLVSMGLHKNKFVVITFGAPAIGNAAFAEAYGDKITLLRITNTADPVPGSLQTFFGGYKQFGEHYKYHMSTKISNFQHDMAMYFDYSVSEYYKAFDEAVAAGVAKRMPNTKLVEGSPVVALWITEAPGLKKYRHVPDIKRFITNEYKKSISSYVVMDKSLKADNTLRHNEILELSRMAGADFVLICGIDGKKVREDDYWYIALEQALFTADGKMLSMGSFAKKVMPASGNVQAAGENFLQAREALKKDLPIRTRYEYLLDEQ